MPKPTSDEIQAILRDHEARLSALEKGSAPPKPPIGNKKQSIKEFIISKKPKDETAMTLAIGYFLEKFEDKETFNVRDLEDGFRRAKEKVPGNINDKVNKNIAAGHMMDSPKKDGLKSWTLTNSGEKFVEADFQAS